MSIEQAVIDLEADILRAVGESEEALSADLDRNLRRLAQIYLAQMRSGAFTNRSGDLRRSMYARVEDNTLKLGMLFYGYFVSFGVAGNKYSNALPLSNEVASIFNKREGQTFGSNNVPGIRARNFYPTNLEEEIDNIVAEAIQKVEI